MPISTPALYSCQPLSSPESSDYNVRRHHDEIRLWSDYITPGAATYVVDDQGDRG